MPLMQWTEWQERDTELEEPAVLLQTVNKLASCPRRSPPRLLIAKTCWRKDPGKEQPEPCINTLSKGVEGGKETQRRLSVPAVSMTRTEFTNFYLRQCFCFQF